MKRIPRLLLSPIVRRHPPPRLRILPVPPQPPVSGPPQESAEELCRKASDLEYELRTDKEADYTTVAGLYRQAAELGYAPAQLAFARCRYTGRGVEKDMAKGREWCLRAAETDAGVWGSEGGTSLHGAAENGHSAACKLQQQYGAE
ncbi:MAG: hypothetical protein Q4F30_07750 [Akkermansia sp.]|nr:hypothetical protein [Akkermansia sp.]